MKSSQPKADPQTWANMEHLVRIGKDQGDEASVEEFRRMFAPGGTLPPIEPRHRALAASYRRWMPGGEAEMQARAEDREKQATSSTPQPTSK